MLLRRGGVVFQERKGEGVGNRRPFRGPRLDVERSGRDLRRDLGRTRELEEGGERALRVLSLDRGTR